MASSGLALFTRHRRVVTKAVIFSTSVRQGISGGPDRAEGVFDRRRSPLEWTHLSVLKTTTRSLRPISTDELLHAFTYIWDPRALIALGTTSTLLYQRSKDKRKMREDSYDTYVTEAIAQMSRPFESPEIMNGLPLFQRENQGNLERAINRTTYPCFIGLIEGPAMCGKTEVLLQLCSGRTNTVYLSLRRQKLTAKHLASVFGIGKLNVGLHPDIHLESVLDIVESALEQVRGRRLSSDDIPLIIVDDIRCEVDENNNFTAGSEVFLTWLLEMKNRNLMNVLLLTSHGALLRPILSQVSGFASRLVHFTFGSINDQEMSTALAKRFDSSGAKLMCETLGGHFGHIEHIIMHAELFGKSTVRAAVDEVMEEERRRLVRMILGQVSPRPPCGLDRWTMVCLLVFEELEKLSHTSDERSLPISTPLARQLPETSLSNITLTHSLQGVDMSTINSVLNELAKRNIIFYRDGVNITWQTKSQMFACKLALQSKVVIRRKKETQIRLQEKELRRRNMK